MIDDTTDLSPKELAALLNVSESTAQRYCQRGDVPARRVGGRWRVKVAVLRHRHPDLWAEMAERAEAQARAAAGPSSHKDPFAFEPGDVV